MWNESRSGGLSLWEVEEEGEAVKILKGLALVLLVAWTITVNTLVFVVLYKNPKLQTVPNLLVGNLAFSDICLSLLVLPFSAIYAVANEWLFGQFVCEVWLSMDILSCTASIWNMSTIAERILGLDRYWAITSPVAYMNKRNKKTAFIMIAGVWVLAGLICVAPFLGWKSGAPEGNHKYDNETRSYQCEFLDLPGYTIYSATGSFFVPSFVMFFVYYKIYKAFAEHRARQVYRQRVIKKHIESTILHDIGHVLPTGGQLDDEDEDDDDDDDDDSRQNHISRIPSSFTSLEIRRRVSRVKPEAIIEEDEEGCLEEEEDAHQHIVTTPLTPDPRNPLNLTAPRLPKSDGKVERLQLQPNRSHMEKSLNRRREMEHKPPTISAAKEKRGVKVLGIILGCFTVCWTPFFTMYIVGQFCAPCRPNHHVTQFITWLGYSNSAMNPIIYTVFNRDYQNALKRLFARRKLIVI